MLNELVSFINDKVSGANASLIENEAGDKPILIDASKIKDVCYALRDSSEYQFNVLQVVSGVDYPEEIEVNYMLASFITNSDDVILKVKLPKANKDDVPKIDSVCDVWKSANFLEREVYDMNGVEFVGHPDFRRILCPEDWEGFPLRKDYEVQKAWQGHEINPEHKINNADHEFFAKARIDAAEPKKISGSWDGKIAADLEAALNKKMEEANK